MGKLSDHPDFEEVAGIMVYVGKADPPTDAERAEYERQLAEEA